MSIERINPDNLIKWPPMATVVVAPSQKLAFIAGQTAIDKDFNHLGGDDFAEQTRYAMKNLLVAIEAAGAKPEDVVTSTAYVVDLTQERSAVFASVMEEVLDGKPFPPHAINLIGTTGLGGGSHQLIEITAIAAIS